ncbi:MAG: hypothetical protein ACLGSA_05460 [Acidobacteriota bacterium]
MRRASTIHDSARDRSPQGIRGYPQEKRDFMPGPLDAGPGILYPTPMNTLIRSHRLIQALCLSLSFALALCTAVPASWAKTDDAQKTASGSTSKQDAKSKTRKDSGKSRKSSEEGGSKKKSAPKASTGGFRGLAWGSPLSVLKEPDLREKDGDLAYYTVTGDDMDLLGVSMREVVYVFCKGRLAGALTRYDGEINHLQLQARLGETYGTPLEAAPNPRGDRSWRYDEKDTSIVVEYAKAGTGAVAFMAKDKLAICQGPPADAAPAVKKDQDAASDESGEEAKPKSASKTRDKAKDKTKSKGKSSDKTSGNGKTTKTDTPAQQ